MKNPNHIFTTMLLALGFLALSSTPNAFGVVPAPDGGYPNFNTAEGQNALKNLTTGPANTACGAVALFLNKTGENNTAVGAAALLHNDSGDANTAIGRDALLENTIGIFNTATGLAALTRNTMGESNTADGVFALHDNVDGKENTAIGQQALATNGGSGADDNTATGFQALFSNFTGEDNTANGAFALSSNDSGLGNTALGADAGNTVITGSGNVFIGAGMVGTAGNETDHTYIRNINTTSVSGGNSDFVTVDLTTGLLGHQSSSRRYKEDIKPMDNGSEVLYRLKPVTYRYKKEIDRTQSLDYGLVAEDVANVDPNLAIRDRTGQIESVRYSAVNAMLLNEFLKEHKKVEQLKNEFQATVAQQQKEIQVLTAQLKEQAAQIQKVSAQVETSKPAPQVVLNNP